MEHGVRFFIPNNALKGISKKVANDGHVGCGQQPTTTKRELDRPVNDFVIGARSDGDKRGFVFVESRLKGTAVGKTLTTYTERSGYGKVDAIDPEKHTGIMYAVANTNQVSKGGVSRGAVPTELLSMRPIGFTGYCDANSFTKWSWIHEDGFPKIRKQDGMNWVYGEFLFNQGRTGVYGWAPGNSLGLGDGPGTVGAGMGADNQPLPSTSKCNYRPAIK